MIFNGYITNKEILTDTNIDKTNIYPISSLNNLSDTEREKIFNIIIPVIKNTITKYNLLNNQSIPLIFNRANRPITTNIKTHNDIQQVIETLYLLLKSELPYIYITNVVNILEKKTEDEALLKFDIIVEYGNLSNIMINAEIIYEKLYSNEDNFYTNIKDQELKIYLSRFELNKKYNSNYLFE
jgi:hypothetical protein